MTENNSNNKRIAKNTIVLYGRMMIVMIINLYAVRLVLNSLGVIDYGIYDVVSGIIYILSSVSSVLSTATQRYYSFSIGKKNKLLLQQIFSTSLKLYFTLSIVVLLIGESFGLWFINYHLTIPIDRVIAANWIYQFSILSFILTILSIPFSAAIIAHEKMGIFALISSAESILKLIAAILITHMPFDNLIFYGAAIMIVSLLVLIMYIFIARRKFTVLRYQKVFDSALRKELLSFSGWSLFGSVAGIGMTQVNSILINIFHGPVVSSARAISIQINSAISSFTGSFLMAIRPQMIMSYSEEAYSYLNMIFYLSNKLIYYSLLILCLPLILNMDTILFIWLKTSDEQAILFSRLILIYAMIMSLNNPISIIIQATGHVKPYHIFVEIFTLLSAPVTYILYMLGYPAYSTYVVMIVTAILSHIVRLVCLKKYYNQFQYSHYIYSFLIPALLITIITTVLINLLHVSYSFSLLRFAATCALTFLMVFGLVFSFGLSKSELNVAIELHKKIKKRIGM